MSYCKAPSPIGEKNGESKKENIKSETEKEKGFVDEEHRRSPRPVSAVQEIDFSSHRLPVLRVLQG